MKRLKYATRTLALWVFACLSVSADNGNAIKDLSGAAASEAYAYVKAPNNRIVDLNINEKTATALAEAVLVYIYGEDVLKQKPWVVVDLGTAFKIKGQLPKNYWGGVAEIVIRKADAKVLSFSHEK